MTEPTPLKDCIAEYLAATGLADELTLHFDGACEPRNPGGVATYGWVLSTGHSGCGVVATGGPTSTNNLAEWSALGFGLRWIADQKLKPEKLLIFGDSQLVVRQLNHEWACNKEHLQKLRARCEELLKAIDRPWAAEWIPREKNEDADALSRKAYTDHTGKPFPERRRA